SYSRSRTLDSGFWILCFFGAYDRIDHNLILFVLFDFAQLHAHALFFRAGNVLAHVVRFHRNLAVTAVDQNREAHRARAAGFEDDAERAVDRLACIDDVVDDDHRPVFHTQRLGRAVVARNSMNAFVAAEDFDLGGFDFPAVAVFDLRGDASREHGAFALDAEQREPLVPFAVLENLLADLADRGQDLFLTHDAALRPALIRLVVELFRLLDGVENRELAAREPFHDGLAERRVAGAIPARYRVADKLHLELVVAIEAAENQSAPRSRRQQLEARLGRLNLRTRDAVEVGAFRSQALRAAVKQHASMTSRSRPRSREQKLQQRHAHRHAVGGLL